MALTQTPTDFSPSNIKTNQAGRYVDLNQLLANINAPDNRPMLIHTFGDQNLTGFLKMTNAITNVGMADEVETWQETRLQPVQVSDVVASAAAAQTRTYPAATVNVRLNDVVLLEDGETRAFVTAVTATSFTATSFDSTNLPAAVIGVVTIKIIGNTYAQGTEQPTEFFESMVDKRKNGFFIIKDIYRVTGSQATNKAWITLPDGRKYWYLQSQNDTNARFNNWREVMLCLGETVKGTATANIVKIGGSEGYFSAIEDRGIITPKITDVAHVDDLIAEFDRQGGVSSEYSMFLDRSQDLAIDDLLAHGLASSLANGLESQFGTFGNDPSKAVRLGFSSFRRGDYSFHKTSWKLLNDPTMLGGSKYKGAILPTGSGIYDGYTSKYCPSLEMNYKSSPEENRLMKSWRTGSVLGANNQTIDAVQFNYLSEVNLVTRAANQHVLVKY